MSGWLLDIMPIFPYPCRASKAPPWHCGIQRQKHNLLGGPCGSVESALDPRGDASGAAPVSPCGCSRGLRHSGDP
eukprot:8186844-Pyramimonas_sp.AAC.1